MELRAILDSVEHGSTSTSLNVKEAWLDSHAACKDDKQQIIHRSVLDDVCVCGDNNRVKKGLDLISNAYILSACFSKISIQCFAKHSSTVQCTHPFAQYIKVQ